MLVMKDCHSKQQRTDHISTLAATQIRDISTDYQRAIYQNMAGLNTTQSLLNNNSSVEENTTAASTPLKAGPPRLPAWLQAYGAAINTYVITIILLVGLAGNLLIIFIINKKRFRGFTISVYFTALAIFDNLVLALTFINMFFGETLGFRAMRAQSLCYFYEFLVNVTTGCANWLVVCIAGDRLFAVLYPMKAKAFQTRRRALQIVTIVMTVVTLRSSTYIWMRDFNSIACVDAAQFLYYTTKIRPVELMVLYNVIPIVSLILAYVTVIRSVRKAENRIRAGTNQGTSKTHHLTKTSMYICLAFVILTVPMPCYLITRGQMNWTGREPIARAIFLTVIVMKALNHSTNFFITTATNAQFRGALKKLMSRKVDPALEPSSTVHTNAV